MHTEFVARRPVRILGVDYPPGAVINDATIPPGVLATLTSTRRIAQRINGGPVVDIPIDPVGSRAIPPHPIVQPGSGPSGLYVPEQGLVARTLSETLIRSDVERLTFLPTRQEESRGSNRPPHEPEAPDGVPPPPAPPGGPIGDPAPDHQPEAPEAPSEAPDAPDEARGAYIDPLPWRAAWQNGVAIRPGFTGTFRAYLMARCAKAEVITTGSITDLLIRLTEVGVQPVPPVATARPRGEGKMAGRARKQKEANP